MFSLTKLSKTFQKCLAIVNKKINSKLWKHIGFCPLIRIIDLLILKQHDTDIRIEQIETKLDKSDYEHLYCIKETIQSLERSILTLSEDNKILKTKFALLEKEMNTYKNVPTAVAIEHFAVGEEIARGSRF
jgi:hypothetical protein